MSKFYEEIMKSPQQAVEIIKERKANGSDVHLAEQAKNDESCKRYNTAEKDTYQKVSDIISIPIEALRKMSPDTTEEEKYVDFIVRSSKGLFESGAGEFPADVLKMDVSEWYVTPDQQDADNLLVWIITPDDPGWGHYGKK